MAEARILTTGAPSGFTPPRLPFTSPALGGTMRTISTGGCWGHDGYSDPQRVKSTPFDGFQGVGGGQAGDGGDWTAPRGCGGSVSTSLNLTGGFE